MIEQDQFVEWSQQKNGHYYGRRWIDFKFPVNVVDLNLRGIRSYKEAFPHAYTVFLAPDIPPKSMVKRIMRRGGVTLDEAKRRAALGPTMVKQAKTMNFDQFVKVKSGSYDEVFAGIVKRMGDVLTNPRVHESQVMITIGPQITQQQTFDGQVLPFNERDRRYIRERERSIDFNRTAVGEITSPSQSQHTSLMSNCPLEPFALPSIDRTFWFHPPMLLLSNCSSPKGNYRWERTDFRDGFVAGSDSRQAT